MNFKFNFNLTSQKYEVSPYLEFRIEGFRTKAKVTVAFLEKNCHLSSAYINGLI